LLPAIRSRDADHCQAFESSSYWQECGRKEFVAQQQKRRIFQRHYKSDIGDEELIYKHKKRYYYISTYFLSGVIMIVVLIDAAKYMYGYSLTPDDVFDEQTRYAFMCASMIVCPVLYLLTHTLVSRTMMHIFYNESKRQFRGVCYNWCMTRKNVLFKPGEVQLLPESAGAMQFLRGGYIIDKKSYHISAMDFTSTRYYNLMLGFIKP